MNKITEAKKQKQFELIKKATGDHWRVVIENQDTIRSGQVIHLWNLVFVSTKVKFEDLDLDEDFRPYMKYDGYIYDSHGPLDMGQVIEVFNRNIKEPEVGVIYDYMGANMLWTITKEGFEAYFDD